MKLLRNLSLGVALGALTVAGGLLGSATPASAQGAPPGFFAVPGTTTALLITGQVGTRGVYDANDAAVDWPGLTPIGSDILIPLFIPAGPNVSHSGGNNNGSFHFTAKDFSFGFITLTPTAWGELSTVMIFGAGSNLNDPAPLSQAFQNVGVVVAFGTLGPFMAGVNGSLLGDDDASPDTMGEPLAITGQLGGIQPSVRYTWKGPGGFSIAGSLEQNFTSGVSSENIGNFPNQLFGQAVKGGVLPASDWGPDTPFNTGSLAGRTTWPDLIVKARLDQPWGHVAVGGLLHQLSTSCFTNCLAGQGGAFSSAGPTGIPGTALPEMTRLGWAINMTGHVNTWGKDTLKGGMFFGEGVDHYMGDYGGNQGIEVGNGGSALPSGYTNPCPVASSASWCTYVPFSWGIYAAYQHFWTEQLRSTLALGYSHVNTNVAYQGGFNAANVDNNSHLSAAANLIWSPVPKVDLGIEYIYYRVTYALSDQAAGFPTGPCNTGTFSGCSSNAGTDNRIIVESIFHF
jgi:hypothetical protein